MDKVSICIPTYNMGKFLGFAIESALSQSYKDTEVIVCDNASTDNTRDLLSQFKDKRLKVFRHNTNIGMIRNFNSCIELASCKYIKFLEADDMLEKDCVRKLVEFAEQYPNVAIISCGVTLIDSVGNIIGGHKKDKTEVVPGSIIISRIRRMGNEIGTTTDVMIRRSVLDGAGFFDIDYADYLNEWDLWIRCAEICDVGFIAETLTRVRRHPEQVGAIGVKSHREIDVAFMLIKKLEKRWNTSRKDMNAHGEMFRLYLHFSEEFIWRGFREIVKRPGIHSFSFLFEIIARIRKNIGFKYLSTSLMFTFFHFPVFIYLQARQYYKNRR